MPSLCAGLRTHRAPEKGTVFHRSVVLTGLSGSTATFSGGEEEKRFWRGVVAPLAPTCAAFSW